MLEQNLIRILKAFNESAALKPSDDVYVGAVYDTASQPDATAAALIVGINYGQAGTSTALEEPKEHVGYAKHAAALGGGKSYRAVLWNFFPYLTKKEWLADINNSDDEASRIFDKGYDDPFDVFDRLVRLLNPELIVFHGVSSSVSVLARVAIRRVGRTAILVPNLSRGLKRDRIRAIA